MSQSNTPSSSSSSTSTSSLPRGLVTRQGAQMTSTTQRLPSLRSSSDASGMHLKVSTSPSSSISSMAPPIAIPQSATTKGGVMKRTFKPTIPTSRNVAVKVEEKLSSLKPDRKLRSKPNKGGDKNKKGGKNNYIQTEAAVFNGEAIRPQGFARPSSSLRGGESSSASTSFSSTSKMIGKSSDRDYDSKGFGGIFSDSVKETKKSKKLKADIKEQQKREANVLQKLYGDNFIDDGDEDEDEEDIKGFMFPKGWECISERHGKQHVKTGLSTSTSSSVMNSSPYEIFKNEEDDTDKFLLMQIPDMLLNKSPGYVGKLRVYKSGKIEIEDTETGMKYDIIVDNKSGISETKVKSESILNASDTKKSSIGVNNRREEVCREIVSLGDDKLTSLGTIKHHGTLTVIPQIPLDD